MIELRDEYFEWMYQLVCDEKFTRHLSYRKLCRMLDDREFVYTIPMDANRFEDGTDLRYRFGYEHDLEGPIIATELDDRPCSIFEMMVALAIRCEEHIMDNPDIGNRTTQWFLDMVASLGLAQMTDEKINRRLVDQVLDRFLERDYGRDGEGGLFTIRGTRRDMRHVDIWYQAMWYLNEVLRR